MEAEEERKEGGRGEGLQHALERAVYRSLESVPRVIGMCLMQTTTTGLIYLYKTNVVIED